MKKIGSIIDGDSIFVNGIKCVVKRSYFSDKFHNSKSLLFLDLEIPDDKENKLHIAVEESISREKSNTIVKAKIKTSNIDIYKVFINDNDMVEINEHGNSYVILKIEIDTEGVI